MYVTVWKNQLQFEKKILGDNLQNALKKFIF